MKKCFKVSLSLLAAFAISTANAEPVIEKVIDEPLLNRVQASLPGKVSAVYVSELPGIYEVHTESKWGAQGSSLYGPGLPVLQAA